MTTLGGGVALGQQPANGLLAPQAANVPRAWQSEADNADRQVISNQIFEIFSKRRPAASQSWTQRLPDFIKRLEEALYRTAQSKEEYLDQSTLEARLQLVAKKFSSGRAQGGAEQPGVMPQQQQQHMMPGQSVSGAQQSNGGVAPAFVPNNYVGFGSSLGPGDGQGVMMRTNGMAGPSSPALGMDGAGTGLAMGMVPNPGFNAASSSTPVMSNGAPVLRGRANQDMTAGPLPNGTQGPMSMPAGLGPSAPMGAMAPMAAMGPPGFVPNNPGPGPMVPVGAPGMVPVNSGMPQPNGMMGMGRMPSQAGPGPGGMVPVGPPGMVPMGGGMMGGGPMAMPGPGPIAPAPVPPVPGGAPSQGASSSIPGVPDNLPDEVRQQYIQKQQRWLLFLRHCAKCRASEHECQLKGQCKFGKQLWQHILQCANPQCEYPRCTSSKDLLKHHQKCQSHTCPICAPVKEYVKKTRLAQQQQQGQGQPGQGQPGQGQLRTGPPQQQHQQQPGFMPGPPGPPGFPGQPMPGMMMGPPGGMGPIGHMGNGMGYPPGPMAMQQQPVMQPPNMVAGHKRPHSAMAGPGPGQGPYDGMVMQPPGMMPVMGGASMGMVSQQQAVQMQPLQQQQQQMGAPQARAGAGGFPDEHLAKKSKVVEGEAVIAKNTGTSLLEAFTADQIRTHLEQLRASAAQQRNAQQVPPNPGEACKACGLVKLSFEPPVIYCTMCGIKIKRGQVFYSTPLDASNANDLRGCWCHTCYQETRKDSISYGDGASIKKSDLVKRKNDEEVEEGWVACDNCEIWVHQICVMFNKGRNNNDTHYLCPDCLILGLETGQRQRLEIRPQSMLEAKDLPTCRMSDFLQRRLAVALDQERHDRASMQGKMPHEVAGVEGLTVRVVNSVVKKCEVKPRFMEAFQSDGYPTEFMYRQRVVLLFQQLDGVDVCLYCMYVQEYGDDCPPPNRNCVYLSYLDSIKYFRPELSCAYNPSTSLRTYVYHQLLIGYLNWVKMLGFEQMYIWACPPMQGDDYILYCHPSKQKVPRSDRLRHWYLDMLKLAKNEGIVVHLSTLWDTYFEGGRDHRLEKCSATMIPYLEGDYWPGEAEVVLGKLQDQERQTAKGSKKPAAPSGTAAARKAGKGKRYGGGPASTDEALMSQIGEILGGNMREDFIVVHLREVCTFCRAHVNGAPIYRYQHQQGMPVPKGPPERKFEGIKLEPGPNIPAGPVTSLQICEPCLRDEQHRFATGGKTRLPQGVMPEHLRMEKVEPLERIPDPDPDMDNEFFETRQTFLSLCQGNHYQFDTARRAKHSSMMVLYHLHNPSAPAFTVSCNKCNAEIEPGQGWRCTVCQDFDLCTSCKTHIGHPHPLIQHARKVDETRTRLTDQERRERNEQLQRTMQLLVHACSCNNPACQSSSCRRVRQLFNHAVQCQQKVTGGCNMCKKMWCLLNLHAKQCTRSECPVPRCKELKELRRRQNARQEDQRRAAYATMMRSQANGAGPSG